MIHADRLIPVETIPPLMVDRRCGRTYKLTQRVSCLSLPASRAQYGLPGGRASHYGYLCSYGIRCSWEDARYEACPAPTSRNDVGATRDTDTYAVRLLTRSLGACSVSTWISARSAVWPWLLWLVTACSMIAPVS